MDFQDIIFEASNETRIAKITFNTPETRNAITAERTIDEIEEACKIVNSNRKINVLIITGTDPAFSSGGNVKDMQEKKGMFDGTPTELMNNYMKYVQRIPKVLYSVETPIIASVNGPAIGAGFDITMMCDIRIASEKAKFGETFLNVGIIPGDGGAYFLPRAVGMAKACELTFTGDIIDAKEALKIGLVNYVVPHKNLNEKTMEISKKIAAKPPEALRMSKRLLYMGQNMSMNDLLNQSAAYQSICHYTEDHMEALSAFFEKREAHFKGK
ncbi:MAG: crotonase/enoyl-CoA hydratase family protein [Desulfobacterales bacterium]|nr:crotonase/enoyl-CoA hydratase family protein [Desulfobacterales bacterium]MCP4159457.1 crotonase/enoyl-CoA hydratase family protein [Deltaproteobacteria bacterium]